MPATKKTPKTLPANAEAASGTLPTWPTIALSVSPIKIWLTCPTVMGRASASVWRSSERVWRMAGMG